MIALDFGTRSIVCACFEGVRITAAASCEHKTRAMREGSIYDLEAARESLIGLRARMDLPEGTAVAIAIAGAQLSTERFEISLTGEGTWTEAMLREAEEKRFARVKSIGPRDVLLGVHRSHCVIDGKSVATPVGREGKAVKYRVLATFLPMENVKLKTRVVEQAGFQPTHITVEPMAIGAALLSSQTPPHCYALVDIGAGTSDIAVISPDGLAAVGSIPFAGDTITESISKKLDLVYMEADAIKRNPAGTVVDIWGESRTFSRELVETAAEDGVELLVSSISAAFKKLKRDVKIEEFAGIILVGGGSLWPTLPARLAGVVKLDPARIRIRSAESISALKDETSIFRGPEFVTVAGIVLSHAASFHVRRFHFNGRPQMSILPPDRSSSFTVADAFVADNRDPLEYFGNPGEAFIDGDEIRGGEPGSPPRIIVNGALADLDTSIASGDRIEVTRGADGGPARSADLKAVLDVRVETNPATVRVDGEEWQCGERTAAVLDSGGQVVMAPRVPPSLGRMLAGYARPSIRVHIGDEARNLRDRTATALVDGVSQAADFAPSWGATIETARKDWRLYEALEPYGDSGAIARVWVNGNPASYTTPIHEGDRVTTSQVMSS